MAERGGEKYRQQHRTAVRAAAACFAEKGFHGASTRDIAERMGIKQGSLYYYFESKEQALEQVCLYGIEDYVHRMEAIADNDEPFAAKLLATITAHLSSYREKNEALKVFNDERLYLPAERRGEIKALGSRYRQLLETVVAEALAAGTLRPEIDAHFVTQSIIGLCNAWGDIIVRDPELDLFDTINRCNALLLHGLTQPNTAA